MGSVGGLLECLVRENAISDLEDEGIGGLDVRDIEVLSLYVASFIRQLDLFS